jgi:sodium-dependent phosphate cotransporter
MKWPPRFAVSGNPLAPLRRILARIKWSKVGLFLFSLALFILALEFMKTGARGLAPLIRDLLRVNHPLNALGFGWLFAYGVLSGSPVAAASLTFFDAGVITSTDALAMITGSRMGAGVIVLMIGLIYVLRGHERTTSLVTGLLALVVTATVYLPAFPIGYSALSSGLLNGSAAISQGEEMISIIDQVYGPLVQTAVRFLPDWVIFLMGLGVIIGSLNLFDKALPQLTLKESAFDGVPRLLYRPIVTFALGLLITMLTMSVSVSLGFLVPLSARGYIRRENLVPYIMGCNISTFIDTLVAGLLLQNPVATGIVLAEMLSITLVSALILLLFFGPYERAVLRFVVWLTGHTGRLVVFFALIFLIPVGLLFI